MRRKILGLAASCWLAIGAAAQTAPAAPPAAKPRAPMDTAVFAQLPRVEGPKLSPNGKRFAARVAGDGVQVFAIISTDNTPPKLIGLGDNDLNWWRWVNDEWLVVGVGQTLPVQGEDWYVRRALGLNAVTGKIVPLARNAGQSADDVIWTASDGTPRILLSLQTSIYYGTDGFWPHVEEIDVSTGKGKAVLAERDGVFNWYADGDGLVRMGIGASEDGRTRRVLYRDRNNASWKTIDRSSGLGDTLTVPALFLRDRGKALTIADDAEGYSALYELDLATLQRGKQLFASKGFDIAGLIPADGGFGYSGVLVNEDKPSVRWTDPAVQAIHDDISAKIKGGEVQIVSLNRDRSVAIAAVGSADAPGGYLLYRTADKAFDLLAYNNDTLKLKRAHPVKTIRYKARDGLEIAAVLTLPIGRTGALPLIVLPHGGPFARDSEEWDWWSQFLADRGYAVVQPNYRGSSGYGTAFTAKGAGQWGLAMQDDLNDAVTALAVQGVADPKRVCMVGGSYGGYAALRAAQRDGKLYRCAVSFAGVADLNQMRRYDSRFLASGLREDWLRNQAPDLKSVSPVNFPEQFSIPTLIVHGAKDRVVPVKQSRAMVSKLKAAGKPYEYIEQPEADHHFSRGEDRLQFLKALEAFLAKHNPA